MPCKIASFISYLIFMDFPVPPLLTPIFRMPFLVQSPSGGGLRFPPEQWGVTLLSVPCRRGIRFWSAPVLSFVLWSKTTSGLVFPHYLTMALSQGCLNTSFFFCPDLQPAKFVDITLRVLVPYSANDLKDKTNTSLFRKILDKARRLKTKVSQV